MDQAVDELEQTVKSMKYDKNGLLTAVVVDAATRAVLMVAFMDQDALMETIRTGKTHFWSRSRKKRWMKGEESGHTQDVRAVYTDCDKDCLVVEVAQHGGACHDGYYSCFYRRLSKDGGWEIVGEKVFDPGKVYGRGK
jgi:phosphoribosyl-AMP cyclohydrolase